MRIAAGRRDDLRRSVCLSALLLATALVIAPDAGAVIHIQDFRFAVTEADGEPAIQAGAHPGQATATLTFSGDGPSSYESPRNISFDLPPGMVGVPLATPTCKALDFQLGTCSPKSQVGFVRLVNLSGEEDEVLFLPLSNLEPLPEAAAEFGINTPQAAVRLKLEVRTGRDYGISISVKNLSQAMILNEVAITLWGVPADPGHDGLRGECLSPEGPTGGSCPSDTARLPLLTNPSTCLPTFSVEARVDSWQNPGVFDTATADNEDSAGDPVGIEGCESLEFRPTLALSPSAPTPRTPSGLTFELHAPQRQSASVPAEAPLEDVAMTLPEGLVISPPAAAGLGACTPGQIRLQDDSPPSCPDTSKLGTMAIETPMLADPLRGSVYLAEPGDNPFGSRFAIYAAAAGNGILIKLAGRVDPDPTTGRLRVTFDDVPQLPFSDVTITLFPGPRAPLSNPSRCGTYTSKAELTAWGARAPVARSSSFELSAGCFEPLFAPSLRAGTTDPTAGAYSPFTLKLQRGERDVDFASSLSLDLPPGLSAAVGGMSYCPEGELTPAHSQVQPPCPDSSRVGSAVVGAGEGTKPLYLTGAVYLAGPFRGAPFSLLVVVPAHAGPFDLGAIVERIAVDVDPRSGRLTTWAEALPRIHDGVPLDLRTLTLGLDRPGFIRNPTSCRPMVIAGTASTAGGQSAPLSEPFQVDGCSTLAFKPKLALNVVGGAARGSHPALRAVLRTGSREAGIAAVAIGLPAGELLDLRHLGAMCARGVPPDDCPRSSRLGRARVWSPLLGEPLAGSIYLQAPSGRLPRLLVDLRGGGFEFTLGGRIALAKGGLRLRLPDLPDLPLTRAAFTLAGGRRGLLVNSESLCGPPRRAMVSLSAHNGAVHDLRPRLRVKGGC